MSILSVLEAEFEKVKSAVSNAVSGAKDAVHSAVSWTEQELKAAEAEFVADVEHVETLTLSDAFEAGAKWAAEKAKDAVTEVTQAAAPNSDPEPLEHPADPSAPAANVDPSVAQAPVDPSAAQDPSAAAQ